MLIVEISNFRTCCGPSGTYPTCEFYENHLRLPRKKDTNMFVYNLGFHVPIKTFTIFQIF